MTTIRPIRGQFLVIDTPTDAERESIFQALGRPDIHVPLGLRSPPDRQMYDDDILELHQGEVARIEPVRYCVLRDKTDGHFVGFYIDFGWAHANDPIREIDIAIPDPADRNLRCCFDAAVIIGPYMFENGFAKRLRWRVRSTGDRVPKRFDRHGARVVAKLVERHPVSGAQMNMFIFEFAIADYNDVMNRLGRDVGAVDSETLSAAMWDQLRNRGR